ncbi:MAG: hypothetical protein DRI44_10380 [Chlamydiae bacterium]|nr:MAG: hypothetical protein DRI44_10380 [Chlamydiota bacterium]
MNDKQNKESSTFIPPKKSWWEKNYRAVIYIAAFLAVLGGMFSNKPMHLNVSSATKGLFDSVEAIPKKRQKTIAEVEEKLKKAEEKKDDKKIRELKTYLTRLKLNTNGVLLICFDFDPSTAPELKPMAISLLRQAFKNGIKVIGNVGYNVISAQLAQNIIENIAHESSDKFQPKKAGKDYVFLGFRPNAFMVYMQMGESILSAYETDYAGNDLNTLPIMKGVHDYAEIEDVVLLSGYVGMPEIWMNVGKTKFGKDVGLGMTAVSAADYYPYIQSKQITGLLAGLRGAAEYETELKSLGSGVKGMRSQLYAHSLAILLIVIGNIEFFISKFRKKRK